MERVAEVMQLALEAVLVAHGGESAGAAGFGFDNNTGDRHSKASA
jgi:hypothetical protein